MLIDSKGKLFGKISVVDILIVVIVLGALAGVGYKLKQSNVVTPLASSDKIQMVLYTDSTPEASAKAVKIGDTAKDRTTSAVLGKVTNIEIGPSVIYGISDEGKVVASAKPNYVSLKVTVEGSGKFSDMGASFNGSDYYINKSMYETRVGNSVFNIVINDIKKL